MTTVNVVVLAGTVSADPVTRRMPSGDEVNEYLVAGHKDAGVRHDAGMKRGWGLGLIASTLVAAVACTSASSESPTASPSDV